MINQLRTEFYKLQRNRAFWTIILVIACVSALLHYLVIIDWWHMSGTPFDHANLKEFNAISTFTAPIFFNLIISPLAGFYISNEFSHSSVIKNQILSGSKRSHIYLSKYIVFTLGSMIVTIIIPILTAVIEIFLLGHGEIFTTSSMMYLFRAYGLFMVQFMGYTAILVILAIVTQDNGKTIIFSIIFTIVMYVIEMAPELPILGTIYKNSIFYQFSAVFESSMTSGEIMKAIIIALLTFIILLSCGLMVFSKKEVK